MALNGQFGLGVVFDFVNRGMQGIIDTERAFGRMYTNVNRQAIDVSGTLHKMGTAFAGMTAAAAPMFAFKALADEAGRFETGLVKIRNVAGATAEEMAMLRKASIDASLQSRFSPIESNAGLEALASLGFTAKQSMDLLLPTLDFAAANNLEVGKAAEIAGAAMKIYNIQIDDVGFALDRLSKIANLTALGADDLQVALATSAKGAIAAKQGMTELLIAMGLAKNAGLDTSVAANSVNRALLSMATTGKETLEGLGIRIENNKGHFRDFGDVLLDLEQKTRKMTDAQRAKTLEDALGTFGLTASLAIMEQVTNGVVSNTGEVYKGAKALAYLRQQMHNSKGTLLDFKQASTQTWEGQKAMLMGVWNTSKVVLGEPLAKALGPHLVVITTSLRKILVAFEELSPAAKKSLMTFVVGAAAVVSIGGALLGAKAIIGLLIPFLGTLKVSLLAVSFGALLPMIPILVLVWAHWDKVKLAAEGFIDVITSGRMSSELESELQKAENQGIRTFVLAVQDGFDTIKATIEAGQKFWDNHGRTIEMLVYTYAIFRGTLLAWSIGMGTVQGIIWAVTNATKIWTGAQVALNLALNANPIGVLILLGATMIASWTVYKNEWLYLWGEMKDGFWGVVGWIDTGLKKMMNMIINAAAMIPEKFQVGPLKALANMALYDVPEPVEDGREAPQGGSYRGPRYTNPNKNVDMRDVQKAVNSDVMPPVVVQSGETRAQAEARQRAVMDEAVIQQMLADQAGTPIHTNITLELDGQRVAEVVHRRSRDGDDEMFMPNYGGG